MENINIEQIMEEIRAEIRNRNLSDNALDFEVIKDLPIKEEYDAGKLILAIKRANETAHINPNEIFYGNKIKVFLKRAIRKCTRFYVQPLTDKQNDFNSYVAQSLNELMRYVEKEQILIDKIYDLEEKNGLQQAEDKKKRDLEKADLIKKIEIIEKRNEELIEKVKKMEQEIIDLEKKCVKKMRIEEN